MAFRTFETFSVDTTNIFPIANSTKGGQLVTEFNLKSREGVSYYESVKYNAGPSYVHAEEDFKVSLQNTLEGFFPDSKNISTSTLQISPGRGVIDGHYVENLAEMIINLADVNAKLQAEGEKGLGGNLAVGLRVMYNTERTMAGAIEDEDKNGFYKGIQVVIVPEEEVALPTTKKDGVDYGLLENKDKVNMHLLLATFTYMNGNISNVVNNYPEKCRMLPASRIGKIDSIISDEYIKRTNLDEAKIYAFAGKGTNSTINENGEYEGGEETGLDTWCDVTNALVEWTPKVEFTDIKPQSGSSADFIADSSTSEVYLYLPHKQVEGAKYTLHDKNGNPVYFKPTKLPLPAASYVNETPGIVNRSYTRSIKDKLKSLEAVNLMHMTNGKLLAYIDVLNSIEELPPINTNWNPGDYILVGKDYSMIEDAADPNQSAPSTMYVILPGRVTAISEKGTKGANGNPPSEDKYSGVEIAKAFLEYDNTSGEEERQNPENWNDYWALTDEDGKYVYNGRKNADYFALHYTKITHTFDEEGNETGEPTIEESDYYYEITETDNSLSYSGPILITPQIPFATEQMVGGFLNVPANTLDAGYVYLDDTGHLRLLDYALLRSGTLAYQLGEDMSTPAGLSIEGIQQFLDEYVNQRIAFPNANQIQNAENPNIIDITINITNPDDDSENRVINIYDIDSRFNTAIRVNICGNADSSVTVNISDCARVIVNNTIEGTPTINLYRSKLYYDAVILNTLNVISDMELWYEKFSSSDKGADVEPDITVEGMTVRIVKNPGIFNSDDGNITSAEFWSNENSNDFHFKVALQSITFTSSGYVSGVTVLVGSDTTDNVVTTGKFVLHDKDFVIPQGGLRYPEKRFLCPVKVTGSFIRCYKSTDADSNPAYCIQNTSFSLKSQYYVPQDSLVSNDTGIEYGVHSGEIAFLVDSYLVKSAELEDIDVWSKGEYHVFSGKLIYY